MPGQDVADPGRRLGLAAARGHLDHVALGDPEPLGVLRGDLHEGVGRGVVQGLRPAGLGPGVEVVDDPAGGQPERIVVVGLLVRRLVVGGLEDRPAAGSFAR